MLVSSVMTRRVRTVKPTDNVKKAVMIMNRYRIGSVVVNNGKGIITERDVLERIVASGKDAGSVTCASIMSRRVVTIDENESIEDAIAIMAKKNIKKIVVTGEGEVTGIITATDILKSGEHIEYAALKKLAQFFPVYQPSAQAG